MIVTFALYWLAIGSTLWAFCVGTGVFRIDESPIVVALASVAMIVCWPLFAAKWLAGAWRMRG